MTFYEAALEVLRRSGRPLHYKKITEIAIRDNLLSHVGKTPEVTMSARLNQEVKRQDFAALEKKRPGVFCLRDEIAKKLNEEFDIKQAEEEKERAKREEERAKRALEHPTVPEEEDEDDEAQEDDRRQDVDSQEEEDDDEDDGDDETQEAKGRRRGGHGEGSSSDRSEGRSRGRRRRRRGGRGSRRRDQKSDDDAQRPSRETTSKRNGAESASRQTSSRRNGAEDTSSSRSNGTSSRSPQTSSDLEDSGDSRRPSRTSSPTSRRRRSSTSSRAASAHTDPKSSSVDQLEGIAKAAYIVLRDQKGQSLPVRALADEIFERKLAKFHTHDASATVQAALVHDNLIRTKEGKRPLFSSHHDHGRWGLSEWGLSQDGLDKESAISSLVQDCLQDAEALLAQTLPNLAPESLEQMILVVLEKLGYTQIKVSKRGSNGDVYFSAQWRRGLSEVRTCIQLTADRARALKTQDITELRGTLHHYAASEGVIIHLGEITKDAVAEAHQERLAPLTLIDQSSLVKLLIQHTLGVRKHHVPIYTVDMAYFDALSV